MIRWHNVYHDAFGRIYSGCKILDFVNRTKEQAELAAAARKGGLLVIFGRRRVGKSRLLRHWLGESGGLGTQITPKTWPELLEVLSLQKKLFQ